MVLLVYSTAEDINVGIRVTLGLILARETYFCAKN